METIKLLAFIFSILSFFALIICFFMLQDNSKKIAKLQQSDDEQWETIDSLKAGTRTVDWRLDELEKKFNDQIESQMLVPDLNKLNEKL